MIIKEKDSKQAEIDELTSLLSLPLPDNKKFLIERELRFLKSGDRGENDSAYFINFYYAASKNWAIIHDLRLEHNDRVAQIDHLLINRFFNIFVLESKNFCYGVKITDNGEFLVQFNNSFFAIESPIEQNKRHIVVIESVIKDFDIMPKRLGLTIMPAFKSYVLVAPKSRLIRPRKSNFDTSMVIKADMLTTSIEKAIEAMKPLSLLASASKISSSETLKEIAEDIASFHKPMKIDYRNRFSIRATPSPKQISSQAPETYEAKRFYCSKCKITITEKVARFCWDNKHRFGGKAYCFDCQKAFTGRH
ncbi:MAG: nuclease-related domain-containing protein [Nitrospirota bacterium]